MRKNPYIGMVSAVLSGLTLFASLLSIPVTRADAATIFINNTAAVSFTDEAGEYYSPVSDTAAVNVLSVPVFRGFAKTGDPFSPNADSRADTLYFSYSLYDHDFAQDTVSLVIYSGSDTVKTFENNASQDTGINYIYAWDGRDDTGTLLADGIYTYLLTASNADGNSSAQSGTVTLDITPPSGSLLVNGGSQYADTYTVFITMPASDNLSGVDTVVISNTSTFASSETRAYSIRQPWNLAGDTAGGTVRTVYLRFYDRAWNASAVYSDSVILDTVPPMVIFTSPADGETEVPKIAPVIAVFNDIMDTATLNSSTFSLMSSRGETMAGTISTALSADTTTLTFIPRFLRSAETYTAVITTGVRDKAGNAMATQKAWKFLTIRYDTTPPTGVITIDSGALYTNTATVTLVLKAYDAQSALGRMFVSNSTFNNAVTLAYSETLVWTLDPADGLKKVSVWFEDDAFNLSRPYSDTITLDMTPPSILWTSPSDSEINVHTNAGITIAFNDTLDTSTVNTSAFVFTDSLGNTLPASLAYVSYGATSTVTVTPVSIMTSFETYIVTVKAGIRDKSGLSMMILRSWSFVTGDFVAPSFVEPIGASFTAPSSVLLSWRKVTKNMDGTAFTDGDSYVIMRSAVTGGPYAKVGAVDVSETIYLDTSPVPGTVYYYVIRAQDNSGNSSPFWIEVTTEGSVIYRIPRDNSRGSNNDISLNLGTQAISIRNPDVNDAYTRIFLPREAAQALYKASNSYGDDLGIYIVRSASEEGSKTRNLGRIISCYEAIPYMVTSSAMVPQLRFPSGITISMRYEVSGGFIKYTSIPAALADKNLSISYWNGLQWVRMGGSVDIMRQTVSATVNFLGKFAVTAVDVSKFTVLSAEPNPFTPYLAPFDRVVFSLVNPANEAVMLKIFDLTGALVFSKDYPAGTVNVEWSGTDNMGRVASDGVYIYQVQAGDKSYTGTIIMAK